MSERDNFSEAVRRILAERAAYLCSYPGCRELTVMPSSDPEKAIRTGRAAHIHAASAKGPRFDPTQTPEQRANIQNAIHLCSRHADVVDRDEPAHTASMLRQWKLDHEAWVAKQELIPTPPCIEIENMEGLFAGPGPSRVTEDMTKVFRDHVMRIETTTRHELLDVEMEVVFPEKVCEVRRLRGRGGPEVLVEPKVVEWVVSGGTWDSPASRRPTPLSPSESPSFDQGLPSK